VQACLQHVVQNAQAAVGPIAVKAIGITNQRETTVIWSRSTGQPLHNAIVWLDNRTSSICRAWEQKLEGGKQGFREVTGLPVSTYFSAYKAQWLYENVPAVSSGPCSSRHALAGSRQLHLPCSSWLPYLVVQDITGMSSGSCPPPNLPFLCWPVFRLMLQPGLSLGRCLMCGPPVRGPPCRPLFVSIPSPQVCNQRHTPCCFASCVCTQVAAAVDAGDALFGTIDSWLIYKLTGGAGQGVHVTDGEEGWAKAAAASRPAHAACCRRGDDCH
jgi:hypothetical protein